MENKKIKFNGMDLFIIIVAVAVVAAGTYFLCARGGSTAVVTQENVLVRTTVELDMQNKEFAELVKVGEKAAIGEKEKMMTVVESVEIVPATDKGYDIIEGRVLRAEVPDKYDVKITLVGDGTENERDIMINGNSLKVGQKVVVSSRDFAGEGYIIGLETEAKN